LVPCLARGLSKVFALESAPPSLRNRKNHTPAANRATKATDPITIPAIAPPDRPLLLVGLETGEAVGDRGVEPTDTGPEVAVTKYVAPYAAAVVCRLVSNAPLLTEFVSSVEYALAGYLELVAI